MSETDASFSLPPEPAPAEPTGESKAPALDVAGAPWDFLDLVFTIMALFGGLFLAEIAGVIVLTLLGASTHHALSRGEILSRLGSDARFMLPVQLVAYGVVVLFAFLTAHVKHGRRLMDALQWRAMGAQTWMFLFLGMALAFASQLIPVLFPTDHHLPIEDLFRDPLSGFLMAAFGVGVAPFVEEMLFRGMIYPVLERRWGMEVAVLGSAALFTSIHAPQLAGGIPQLGAIFMVGVALGYARGRTGSMAPGFWMHTSYNLTLFAGIIAATKGFRDFS